MQGWKMQEIKDLTGLEFGGLEVENAGLEIGSKISQDLCCIQVDRRGSQIREWRPKCWPSTEQTIIIAFFVE